MGWLLQKGCDKKKKKCRKRGGSGSWGLKENHGPYCSNPLGLGSGKASVQIFFSSNGRKDILILFPITYEEAWNKGSKNSLVSEPS